MGKKEEERGDESEVSLELCIGGGKYARTEDSSDKIKGQDDVWRSKDGLEALDLQRRREIQAMRRQEVRRKREEKVKKSRGVSNGVEERDCFWEERERKKYKIEAAADELSLSLFTQNKNCSREGLYPKVQYGFGGAYSCGVVGEKTYLEQSSSAVSDYQTMSHKGGSSSDTGSHSSPLPSCHYHGISRNAFDHGESHDSSSQTETDQALGGAQKHYSKMPQLNNSIDQMNKTSSFSTSQNLSKESSSMLNTSSLMHMPCVSATGNGPEGKTITGLLYKYSKSEVSIMCVCHGSSFSPAEFVKHAGGIDISHPLKHITIVPSGFR